MLQRLPAFFHHFQSSFKALSLSLPLPVFPFSCLGVQAKQYVYSHSPNDFPSFGPNLYRTKKRTDDSLVFEFPQHVGFPLGRLSERQTDGEREPGRVGTQCPTLEYSAADLPSSLSLFFAGQPVLSQDIIMAAQASVMDGLFREGPSECSGGLSFSGEDIFPSIGLSLCLLLVFFEFLGAGTGLLSRMSFLPGLMTWSFLVVHGGLITRKFPPPVSDGLFLILATEVMDSASLSQVSGGIGFSMI